MRKVNLNVDIRHLSRIEGHGNIRIEVENGNVRNARWEVVETPRFFEVLLKDKHYTSAGILAARICGICSISHCLASLLATENAFRVTVPEAAANIRQLAKHGEMLQSHALHLFFLAAPDFFEETSVIPLVEKAPKIVTVARRMKSFANRICDACAGRTTHPVALQVGGVAAVPSKKTLIGLKTELKQILDDLHVVADRFAAWQMPDFVRETEFVSLKGDDTYPAVGDRIVSSDGVERSGTEYQSVVNEYVHRDNTSKWTKLSRQSYAVGALARFNNNHRLLHPDAAEVARMLGLEPVCHNPFMNHAAQLVESVHFAHDVMRLIDAVMAGNATETMAPVAPRAGEGVGIVEAPRGILFHHYKYRNDGRIETANCVVPTTQNNANIHYDIQHLAAQCAVDGMTDQAIERLSSMLVRAYDPCLSCSVH